jgi:hypothetical protein
MPKALSDVFFRPVKSLKTVSLTLSTPMKISCAIPVQQDSACKTELTTKRFVLTMQMFNHTAFSTRTMESLKSVQNAKLYFNLGLCHSMEIQS